MLFDHPIHRVAATTADPDVDATEGADADDGGAAVVLETFTPDAETAPGAGDAYFDYRRAD